MSVRDGIVTRRQVHIRDREDGDRVSGVFVFPSGTGRVGGMRRSSSIR